MIISTSSLPVYLGVKIVRLVKQALNQPTSAKSLVALVCTRFCRIKVFVKQFAVLNKVFAVLEEYERPDPAHPRVE